MTERITLEVEVDLDAVPGAFHTAEDAALRIQDILQNAIGHYKPVVSGENVRQCEAMHWYAENHGVTCRLPWGHEMYGIDGHDFD